MRARKILGLIVYQLFILMLAIAAQNYTVPDYGMGNGFELFAWIMEGIFFIALMVWLWDM